MKSILIYSGKGGVGKTTTTANIAKTMQNLGLNVVCLDADVQTPSLHLALKNTNIKFYSRGLEKPKIYLSGKLIKNWFKTKIKKILELEDNIDYLLIDCPPSLTDIHLILIESLKIKNTLSITQDSELSRSDVKLAREFFENRGVNFLGTVVSMCSKNYKLKKDEITFIPILDVMDTEKVFEANKQAYLKIINRFTESEFISCDLKSINSNTLKMFFDETIEDSFYHPVTRFVNLSTWDEFRNSERVNNIYFNGLNDKYLSEIDSKMIKDAVDIYNTTEPFYIKVTKGFYNHEVNILPFSLIPGKLKIIDNLCYGVPVFKGIYDDIEITLFLNEIKPLTVSELEKLLEYYEPIQNDCYLLSKLYMQEMYNQFGTDTGHRSICNLNSKWEKHYDKLNS